MEEVYIVKLKGLPPPSIPSQDSLSKDSKTSFYYHTDLTAEAIRGFSYLHIFFGITVLCLSVTNLCFHDNPLALEPPLGITVWCAIAFILLGFFGIITAYKRKCDLSGSIFYVKFQLVLIIVVLSLTLTFAILFMLDLHGPIANQFIGLNIVFSIIVESVILLLTLFTCARVLWPGCINFCAKDWPMQPSLKRKMIVKTNVFTNGIQQDKANIIQSFGPNCVISLNMPPAIPSDVALSSKNSSICSSPAHKINSIHKTSSLSESTSDLAKSLSTIYAIPDEPGTIDGKQHIATISTNSIYYNYPTVGVSTTNLLQTFPTADQQNREQNSPNQKVKQQQPSIIYQNDSSTNNPDYSWYRSSDSGSEEIDPYDTDEFDYCSTEDDDDHMNRMDDHNVNDECHKSSSDDGNGTLEEDSKSITNSESSHTPSTASELVTSDEGGRSFSPRKDHVDYYPVDDQNAEKKDTNVRSTSIEVGLENELKLKVSSIKKIIESLENKFESDGVKNGNHDNEDLDSSSNGDEQPINQIKLQPFSTTDNKQSSPYKLSIIRIESPPNELSTVSTNENDVDATIIQQPSENKTPSVATSTTTTIRLLNTSKTTSNTNKFNKLQTDRPSNQNINRNCFSVAKMGSKLASHPYLCRLRATNAECFERQYPKYLVSSSGTTDSSLSTSTLNKTANPIVSKHTVSFVESHRIPDIQRV